MRYSVFVLLLMVFGVSAFAQDAPDSPVFSINNAFYTLADGEAVLLDGCVVPAAETIDSSIALSPSGEQLAFISREDPEEAFLTICNLATGTETLAFRPNFMSGVVTAPAYSAGSDQIAVSYIDVAEQGTISTVDPAVLGGRIWASDVTISEGDIVNPVLWSADDEILTFTSTLDSTYEETLLGLDNPRSISRQQKLSSSESDYIIEQFVSAGQVISLYSSGVIFVTDLETEETETLEGMQVITDTAPLQLTFMPVMSSGGGVAREWAVVDADGTETPLDFGGTVSQIALSPDANEVVYVGEDAVYVWVDGEATPVLGTEITREDSVTSIVWGAVNWTIR